MKPLALIIAVSILVGALLVFTPLSLRDMIASFPLFKGLGGTEQPKNGALAAQQAMIWRTIDGGTTWFLQSAVEAEQALPQANVLDLKFDVENSNIIYLGMEGAGLYRSFNNGQNWEKMIDRNGALAENAAVYKITQDGKNVSNIYLAVFQNKFGQFLKSTDGGISFVRTYIAQFENYPVEAVAVDPERSNIIYIGTKQGGFFVSSDYGETWNALKWFAGEISDIKINPRDTSDIYVATANRGLFFSADRGATWKEFNKELSRISARHNISYFMFNPSDTGHLIMALANGLVESEDQGRTWRFVNILIPPKALPVDAVTIDPDDSDIWYAGVGQLIYKSVDRGQNWSVQKLDTDKRISIMRIDEKDPQSILLGFKIVKKQK